MSTSSKTYSNSTSDLYQRTTDRIIAALEQGKAPWVKPWRGVTKSGLPTNLATGNEYRGINVVTLWMASVARGFDHDLWITYKQAEHIIKVGTFTREAEEGEEERTGTFLKTFCVFNAAEVEGAELPSAVEQSEHERIEHAERFAHSTKAAIREGDDRACYIRGMDVIQLPALGRFECANSYYATLLHGITHWTGDKTRLDRTFGKRFGDEAYAVEELVAEMGSAFLCGHLGIDGHLQHPEYINHWLTVLGQDKRAIFTAAAKASQAADYIRGFSAVVEGAGHE